MDDVESVVRKYVIDEYLEQGDDREINESTPLISGGIVDSFSMVSLKRFLERRYNIRIPDADASAEAFDSVRKIAALVRKFQQAAIAVG
ncbi:MAG: acyl carrier protein [Terriglobales bacterium]